MPRRLVMSRDDLIRLVSNPALFDAHPGLADLREPTALAIQQLTDSARCRRCGGDVRLVFGVLDEFLARLRAWAANEPAQLEVLRAYLVTRHGFEPRPVVLYYRKGREPRPERFTF